MNRQKFRCDSRPTIKMPKKDKEEREDREDGDAVAKEGDKNKDKKHDSGAADLEKARSIYIPGKVIVLCFLKCVN